MSARHFLWAAAGVAPANKNASLRTLFAAFHPTSPLVPAVEPSFDGQVRATVWGDLLVLAIEGQGARLADRARDKGRPADFITLALASSGTLECHEAGAAPTTVGADQLLIRSISGGGEIRPRTGGRLLCVAAPRSKLRAPIVPGLVLSAKAADPAWSMMWAFLPALEDASRRLPASIDAVFDVLSGLVRLALSGRPTQVAFGADESYPEQIDRYLRLHFGNPALTPTLAAQELGISVRYLNKLLEPGGRSFRQILVALRLGACKAALTDRQQADQTIAEIAFNAGFNDLSQFNRQFRLAFGLTPSTLRASLAQKHETRPT